MTSPTSSLDRRERAPLAELLILAAPTVAQMASYTFQNFTDTWMLSRLGLLEPTASANASMFAFSITSVGFGAMWIVNTLVSQAYGRGNRERCGQYLWQGIWFGIVYGLLMLPLLPTAGPLFNAFDHEPALARMEAQYLAITLSFTALRLAGTAIGQFLIAIDQPGRVLLAAMAGVSANIVANWLLIWGHLGFPEMGLAGAAWGTNVGATVELCVLIVFITRPSVRIFNVTDWRLRRDRFLTLLRLGLPSGLQFIGDVLAWSFFGMWVMATFGTQAMAANTFMMRYMSMSFMPAFGVSAAVTALVGRNIGRGRLDIAAKRAHLGFWATTVYMVGCGLLFLVFRYELIGLFTDDPLVLEWGAMLMLFAAAYQLFDALYIVYSGALRGAGDTLVPAVVTASWCWLMVVGVAYVVAVMRPDWGIAGPWAVASVYGLLLGLFMLVRFWLGGWRHIKIDRDEPIPAEDFNAPVPTTQPA